MTTSKFRWFALVAAIMLVLPALPTTPSMAQGNSRTFPETGKTVKGTFLTYWDTHGGLAQQGYPITDELQEKSDTDGKVYTMQYFERAVFEMHPENKAPFDVLLSLLGNFYYKTKYPSGAPNQKVSTDNAIKYPQTGHSLGGIFRKYWESHGGLAQQGYPISDEFSEVSDLNGKTYNVQYFERAVFEYHPENKAPYDVLLSQLGTFQLKAKQSAIYYPTSTATITLWHGYTGTEAATMTKVVNMLNQKNPNFKVNILAVPFDQLQNKYTTEASTGGGPDIVIGPSDWTGAFADAQIIADITGKFDMSQLLPSAETVAQYNGKQYGIATSMKNVALYYNKDIVKTLPKNTDEMLSMATTLATGNVKYGFALNACFYQMVGYNFAFGGKLFENPKKVNLTTPGTIAWLNWMKKAKDTKGVFVKSCADDDINNLFKTGQAGMLINGPWSLEDYQKALGADKVGVAVAPSTPTGGKFAPFVGTENYYVNDSSKNQQAALDFIRYISSPGIASIWVKEAGQISTNTGLNLQSLNKDLIPFVQQAAQGSAFPNFPAMGQVWDPGGTMINEVLDGKSTAEQAAQKANDAINKAIGGGY